MRGEAEAAWVARLHADTAQALYLHVPFCVRKCAYCDFASWATPRGDACMARYVEALLTQLDQARELGLLAEVATAYVGGGTPTMLGPELLGRLVRAVREACPCVGELTCEANPESLTDEVLAALVDAGVTRLSIGVQSLDDGELAALGRAHDVATARERVRAAVRTGLEVSVDLMCATPGQTDASWERTLAGAVELGVGHVSVYPLQIEEGTPLARSLADEDPAWNEPEVEAARMEVAEAVLEAAGLARYEVASYAREGRTCLHNQAYWTGRLYLGLGVGAASMLTWEGYERLRGRCPRLPELPAGTARVRLAVAHDTERGTVAPELSTSLAETPFELEFLDEGQAAAEDLMLAMRLVAGADPGLLAWGRRAIDASALDEALARVVRRGLAAWQGGRLVPTRTGWLLGNELYGELWALAPGEVRTARLL